MSPKTLLLIDLQNDFCPGGALAVPEGDHVMSVANELMPEFDLVIATQDWHPADHKSFASVSGGSPGEFIELGGVQQILWPDHCVQETAGAAFHQALAVERIDRIIRKGTNPNVDSYSAFFDNGRLQQTELADFLHSKNVTALTVMGLATDYCVRFSVLDALELGFAVTLHVPGCRGIDLTPGDIAAAFAAMTAAGATLMPG